jgi:hypothetical protein
MWSVAELAIVILCCCFPTFPRFLLHIRGRDTISVSSLRKKFSTGNTPLAGAGGSPSHSKASKASPRKSPWSVWDDGTTLGATVQGDEKELKEFNDSKGAMGLGVSDLDAAEAKRGTKGPGGVHDRWYGGSKESDQMDLISQRGDLESVSSRR